MIRGASWTIVLGAVAALLFAGPAGTHPFAPDRARLVVFLTKPVSAVQGSVVRATVVASHRHSGGDDVLPRRRGVARRGLGACKPPGERDRRGRSGEPPDAPGRRESQGHGGCIRHNPRAG